MDKRTLTLTLGVFLLFLPTLPVAAAFHYGTKAATIPTNHSGINGDETYRSSQEIHYEILAPATKYLLIHVGMGGCCPSFEPGDALSATVTAPNGNIYSIHAEIGECHSEWGCPANDPYLGGYDRIVLADPPSGIYEVIIRPSGSLKEIPPALVGASAISWQERENHVILLSRNIWWYYPDGSKKFVEDAGYFGWNDALPRIWGMSVLAVTGWAASVVLLVRARRMKRREQA